MDELRRVCKRGGVGLFVDSAMRDKDLYPTSSEFAVRFDAPLRNVVGFDVLDMTLPPTMLTVDLHNNGLLLTEWVAGAATGDAFGRFASLPATGAMRAAAGREGTLRVVPLGGAAAAEGAAAAVGGGGADPASGLAVALVSAVAAYDFAPVDFGLGADCEAAVLRLDGGSRVVAGGDGAFYAVDAPRLGGGAPGGRRERLLTVVSGTHGELIPVAVPEGPAGGGACVCVPAAALAGAVSWGEPWLSGGALQLSAVYSVDAAAFAGLGAGFADEYRTTHVLVEPGDHDEASAAEALQQAFREQGLGTEVVAASTYGREVRVSRVRRVRLQSTRPFWVDADASTAADVFGLGPQSAALRRWPGAGRYLASAPAGPGRHAVSAPGLMNVFGDRFIVLRCPEIERNMPNRNGNTAGVGVLKLYDQRLSHLRFDFVKLLSSDFHPIASLPGLTFRFEQPSGLLYDFKGIDHHMYVSVRVLEPDVAVMGSPGKARRHRRLNPDYDADMSWRGRTAGSPVPAEGRRRRDGWSSTDSGGATDPDRWA